jgi:hypothetical protein
VSPKCRNKQNTLHAVKIRKTTIIWKITTAKTRKCIDEVCCLCSILRILFIEIQYMEHVTKPLYYGVRLRLREGFKHNFVVYNMQPFTEFDTGIPRTSHVPLLAVFLGLHMQLVNRTWSVTAARHGYINHLKTKRRPLYLKTQPVPRCKHFLSLL